MFKTQELSIPIVTQDEREAVELLSEGRSIDHICSTLQISQKKLNQIFNKPQVKDIVRDCLDRRLHFKLAPKSIRNLEWILNQKINIRAKLLGSLKVLESVGVLKRDTGRGDGKVGVFVNTNVNVAGGQTDSLSPDQIAIIRKNLNEQREEFVRLRGSNSSD